MADKTGKVGGKGKISTLDRAKEASEISESAKVADVGSVKKSSAVGGVTAAKAAGISGRSLTLADQQRIDLLVEEEAEKMFSDKVPASKKALLKEAVKMAIHSGLITEEELGKK